MRPSRLESECIRGESVRLFVHHPGCSPLPRHVTGFTICFSADAVRLFSGTVLPPTLQYCYNCWAHCSVRTYNIVYVQGKFANFNVNEYYMSPNEILISRNMLQSHITYYSCKNICLVLCENYPGQRSKCHRFTRQYTVHLILSTHVEQK